MSPRRLSLLLIAPALLAASTVQAQTPTQGATDQPAAPSSAAAAPAPAPSGAPAASPVESSSTHATPSPVPETPKAPAPWFTRPQFNITAGEGKSQWKLQVYGFAEFDVMNDSTRSFNDGMNSNILARDNSQAGNNGRTQTTIRNTRLGFEIKAPEIGGIKATGRVESDFFGFDPNPTYAVSGGSAATGTAVPSGAAASPSEAGFFNNPTFRIRHAFVKLESEYVDMLAGQSYNLFGGQNYFFGCSLAFLGLPNEVFGRTQQVRLGHTFKTDAVNVDLQLGAFRPSQRDSSVPDGEGWLRLQINDWKAMQTPGNGGTAAFPAALAVSGLVRRYKVDQFSNAPKDSSTDTAWAVAADALIPIIPASDSNDRDNKLTLVGEFTIGSGYANEFTGLNGSGGFSAAPNGMYTQNIDSGLVAYDPSGNGVLHTINWRTFLVGLQYYVGHAIFSVNYTQGDSDNMATLYPKSTRAITKSQYADGNIFFDVTPAVRLGVGYQFLTQTFVDLQTPRNHRVEALALYFF